MAVTATEVASGARLTYQPTGGKLTRLFFVEGLDQTNAANVLVAPSVLPTLVANTAIGNSHPADPIFRVFGYECQPGGSVESPNRKGVFVSVIYVTPDYYPSDLQIEIGGINGTQQVQRWPYGPLQGQPIYVGSSSAEGGDTFPQYIDSGYVDDNNAATNPTTNKFFQIVSFPWVSGGVLLILTRREPFPPNIPLYRGKLNSTFWNGLPMGCWMCRQITARRIVGTSFGNGYWECRYEFQTSDTPTFPSPYNSFLQTLFFKDIHTGQKIPGTDPTDGTNDSYTNLYPSDTANFFNLNFGIGDTVFS